MENLQNVASECETYYPCNKNKLSQFLMQMLSRVKEYIRGIMPPYYLSSNYIISTTSIFLIVFMGIFIIVKVNLNYAKMEKISNQTSLFILKSIENIFEKDDMTFDLKFRKEAEEILKKIIADQKLLVENLIFLVQKDGIVFASSIDSSIYIGEKVGKIIPKLSTIDNIQISEYYFDEKPYQILSKSIKNNNGSIVIARSQAQLLDFWRNEVTSGVTLFSSTSAIMLFILLSHYQQIKRTKEIDDILLEANTCIEAALSRGRCGIWNFNLINKEFNLSQSMYEILGIPYSDNPISFRSVARLIHSDDKKIYDIARSISKGETSQLDKIFRIRHSNGTYVWIRARGQVMHKESVGINIIGIAMDVTEQHYLEKRYAEADKRLAEAIECTSEAFALWDKNEQLVMCNVHYQQAYGLPDHILLPGTKRSVIKKAETHPIIEYYVPDPENSSTTNKEIKLADSRWLQINEWRTHDGGTVSVGTDITQIKRNQKKLIESERRLMATINDLSTSRQILERQKTELSIANSKYQAEKERAEMANKAKSEFLAKMSHELRTPLNAILGFSEVIKEEIFGSLGSSKYYEYAKDIHYSGKHLLNLIDDILEMSKIEADHININKKTIDLTPIIKQSINLISASCMNKNITIEEKISQELIISADERIIKQILFHILSNSLKFTNNGGKIIVRASKIGKLTIITAADTGIGIPKSDLEKIGKPFEQLQDHYSKNKSGSGLGLAISNALINLHGGKLKILSQEGKGTTVIICLSK
ncbi:PAS domain-containing sensor histidine kinase [Candidatus Liberibacter americanus]|uniref:histidine kinase n=1 Tax=Candidatus Liberibacter americanus str. Sao Paulo TaxID=1261131 RepID=U6B5Q0_9HYPH|nr:PAS domain-containing sensor histidine kinase [Candidatus Liberibacter americanus]AHA28168.1 Signal transduction histidine kinase [Candidatus Liberibacter americanus str. Sao Paulo]EMS35920.1 two-component sensor histidine kinase protein [Candidatus Liberibacter americanus PW_SP]